MAGPFDWTPLSGGPAPPGPYAPPRPSPVSPRPSAAGRWLVLGAVALAWLLLLGVAVGRSIVHDGGVSTEAGSGGFTPVGEEIPGPGSWDPSDPVGIGVPEPVETPAGFGVEVPGEWSEGPRFVGGLVVAPTHSAIVALDPVTGEVVWISEDCWGAQWVTPIHASREAQVAVFDCAGDVVGMDAASGDMLWRRAREPAVERVRVGPTVVVLQGAREVTALDLRTGAQRGSWPGLGDANAVSNSTAVFVSNNVGVHAFALDSGEKLWSVDQPSSGLAATDDAVYARANGHWMTRLDPVSGRIIWMSEHEDVRLDWSDVVGISDSAVFVQATDGTRYLTAYDLATGRVAWVHDPEPDAAVTYAVGTRLVVITEHSYGAPSGAGTVVHDERDGSVVARLGEPGTGYNAATDGDLVAAVIGTFPDTTLQILRVG